MRIRLIISAGVLLGAAACIHRKPDIQTRLASWESHYPRDPRCDARISLGRSDNSVETGALVIVAHPWSSDSAVGYFAIGFDQLDSGGVPGKRIAKQDTATFRLYSGLKPGRYRLTYGAIGYHSRVDTVSVRRGATDTLRAGLELFDAGHRNEHNCSPRRFRRPGQPACVTDSEVVKDARQHAIQLLTPSGRRMMHLPQGDTLPPLVAVVDEPTCQRAGDLYGEPDDPPRRVVVITIGRYHLVFDPFEPVSGGEWNVWTLFDEHWRPVLGLLG